MALFQKAMIKDTVMTESIKGSFFLLTESQVASKTGLKRFYDSIINDFSLQTPFSHSS